MYDYKTRPHFNFFSQGEQLIRREGRERSPGCENGIYDYKTRLLFTYVRSAGECDPMSRARFRHKPIECAGERQFPRACLTDSSQADTALRKISLAGFAKIWLAVGEKSLAPAAIRKNVQVSRKHLTLGSLQTCEAALPEEARIMSVERKIFLC